MWGVFSGPGSDTDFIQWSESATDCETPSTIHSAQYKYSKQTVSTQGEPPKPPKSQVFNRYNTHMYTWVIQQCMYSRKIFDVCVQPKFCVKDQLGSAFTLNVPICTNCIRTRLTVNYTERNMWNEVYPGLRLTTWTCSSKTIYFPSSATFWPVRSSSEHLRGVKYIWTLFGYALLFAFLWTTWTWISNLVHG